MNKGGRGMSKYTMHVLVCGGTGCLSSRSAEIVNQLTYYIEKAGLKEQVQVLKTGCFGFVS